jgi:hypothetical protein
MSDPKAAKQLTSAQQVSAPPTMKRSRRRPDYRRIKIHRTYSIGEAAACMLVHKQTVRAWVKQGLALVDLQRPALIHGSVFIAFLKLRREKGRRPCGTAEIYCVRCRIPKTPAFAVADYIAKSAKTGNLVGICPSCERLMYRCVSLARLDEVRGVLEVIIVRPHLRIAEQGCPSVQTHLEQGDVA